MLFRVALLVLVSTTARGQARGNADFQLTKFTKNLITTPQFTYTGAQQYPTNSRDRWLEVEVEFTAAPLKQDERRTF